WSQSLPDTPNIAHMRASCSMDRIMTPEQLELGDIALSRIVESEGPLLAPSEIFMDCTAEHVARNRHWLAPRFYDPESDRLVMAIQSFLIRRKKLTILIDTCVGEKKSRKRSEFH